MTENTPTTEEVRSTYGDARCENLDGPAHAHGCPQGREFDRWLSELIRKEREDAWTEGFDRGFYRGQVLPGDRDASEAGIENPYRKE